MISSDDNQNESLQNKLISYVSRLRIYLRFKAISQLVSGEMYWWSAFMSRQPFIVEFIADTCLRGVSQVVFINNPLSGLIILVALLMGAWVSPAMALLGSVFSTLAAHYLKLDSASIRRGLFGFNGTLVGASILAFSSSWPNGSSSERFSLVLFSYLMVLLCVASLMSFLSTVLSILINPILVSIGASGFTLPFNVASIIFLLGTYQYGYTWPNNQLMNPQLPPIHLNSLSNINNDNQSISNAPTGPILIDTSLRQSNTNGSSNDISVFWACINAAMRGIAQIYFADSALSGLLLLVGIAISAPISACFCLGGSLIGMQMTALALGADGMEIFHGLWGYNACLAALAINAFYSFSKDSLFLSILCCILATMVFGALKTLLSPLGMPALTFPFCFAAIPFVVLRMHSGLRSLARVNSNETNQKHQSHSQKENASNSNDNDNNNNEKDSSNEISRNENDQIQTN